MNIALVYDSETTGMPDWNKPSDGPQQPHLAQLAAHQVDLDTRKIIQTLDVIIKPEGWEIPDDVAAVHGITTEHALDVGVREKQAVELFLDMWSPERDRIGHNESFDARILRIALKRYFPNEDNGADPIDLADLWKGAPAKCTARLSTAIVGLPPTEKMVAAGRNHPKTPNLAEAYEYFMGKPLENAHQAIVDVNACLDVYFAIQDSRRET